MAAGGAVVTRSKLCNPQGFFFLLSFFFLEAELEQDSDAVNEPICVTIHRDSSLSTTE